MQQLALTGIYRTRSNNQIFTCTRNILQDRAYVRPSNINKLDAFKNIDIIQSMFSNHNKMKLEITNRRNRITPC